MLYLVLRLLHLLFMAIWIGAVLFIGTDAKRSLAEPTANMALFRSRLNKAGRLAFLNSILTGASGLGLIFVMGGFGNVAAGIHMGLLVWLVMFVVGAAVIGRSSGLIDAGLESGAEPASLLPLAKRMNIGLMAFHTLWLISLFLMVFRHSL